VGGAGAGRGTAREALEEGEDAVGLVSAGHPFDVLTDADITPEEAQASEEDDDDLPQSPLWASTSSPTTRPGSPVNAPARYSAPHLSGWRTSTRS
jgi:hypothetical protein